MPAITPVATDASHRTTLTTTLFDLIAALHDEVEEGEEDLVTAAVVSLWDAGRLRFLASPNGGRGGGKMAIVLIEEVLVGLDEIKALLEQAVAILTDIIEEMHPDLETRFAPILETSLRHPLQSRVSLLERLLEELAAS